MEHTKANKSKVLALILGLTACLALMLGIVFASPTNTVYAAGETLEPYDSIVVNGKSSESFNNGFYLDESYVKKSGNPDKGYVAKYNNGVLTLNNYDGGYVGTSAVAAGYYEINLIGNNVITGSSHCVLMSSSHGGRVTIKGDGTLTLNAGDCGIDAGLSSGTRNNDVVIEGNAKVTINATRDVANESVIGIIAENVTIQGNASVDIIAKNTNTNTASNWVKGIFADNSITINTAGTINIDVSEAGGDNAYSYGIHPMNTTNCTKVGNMTVKWKKNGSYGSPILGGSFSDKDHAINVNEGNCYASYRYGIPRYVLAANGKLVGPGVPESLNTNGGNFLAGDKITLNAPNLQVSETNTTNIPFDKWFSFANDVTITNPTSQAEAKVTVQDKDIEVRANYKAFTVQPVFERLSGTKGTVTFTLISSEFNSSFWLNIRPINDLGKSKGSVMLDSGTTYKATLEDNGTDYGTPAGEYVVDVVYNNKTLYSEPFTVDYTERKATIGSVTISGEQGETIANTDVTVTLTGYTFATTLSGNWITNLPAGLVQTLTRISDTKAKITVSGTPTALSDQVVNITITKANITGLTSDLTAESNSDAKFNIVATLTEISVPKAKTNLTYTAGSQIGVEGGVGYTLTGNSGVDAKTYTAIAKLESGYKWNDGTITDKEISWSIGKRNPIVSDFNFYEPSNLTYDGNAKTATVSLIAHYGDETGFAITVKYKKGGVIVSDVKDAGEYEVYIDTTATANFNAATDIHDVSWKFTIAKAEQSAPSASLFTTVAPTATTTTDGKITGITAKMEYRKVGDSAWTSGTGSDVTGLSSGRYQIRFKETDNYNAGEVVEVQVPESGVSSYNLTVIGGTGEGVFIQGASVTITANAPATGKRFSGWTIEGISGLDTTQTSLTFNMPANAVTATANYEDIEYTITVNGGKADKTKAKYGESVTITANAPATGKEFDKWVVTGITLSDEDLAKSTVTFEMPASNVTMEAHFRDIESAPSVEIKVEGGTGGGTYKQGDEVTVTAEDKEGKEFKCWKDESGKIVSTNKSYTFTVTEATTLTAVYEDKSSGGDEITPPAKKDGLSGGQIAGIVIGSVAVAGIGGFAIFWFAVKKKTFADLGVALKKGFTAIGKFFKNLGAKIKALFTKKK